MRILELDKVRAAIVTPGCSMPLVDLLYSVNTYYGSQAENINLGTYFRFNTSIVFKICIEKLLVNLHV